MENSESSDEVQRQIDRLLRLGMVFSIVWLAGIGSFIAIRSGLKARRLIKQTPGTFGMGRVWGCLIVGAFGLAIWVPVILANLVNLLITH